VPEDIPNHDDVRGECERQDGAEGSGESVQQAVSPVVGVVLVVALTLLLASVVTAGLASLAQDRREKAEEIGIETATGNPWIGSPSGLVQLSDDRAGASDVRYRMNFTIEPGSDTVGNSLNSVELEVRTGSPDMFSGTSEADLQKAAIDEGSDGTIDRIITDDVNGWKVSDGGSTVKIEFSGAYVAEASDSIIVVFGDVDNPNSPGTYDLAAQTSGDGNWHDGSITIR